MRYTITVKTGTRRAENVEQRLDGSLLITTRAKPIDGAANSVVIALLSRHFKVPKSNIRIISGAKSKIKIVEIG